ncbi:truncated hemoglobin YjbI [Geodermatophilus sabuli]|uniref:Uncharacterized protein n=1 Tax=Geodermatophilus sabuli TaxID=1564158 RepID=A0A285EHL1_9ACTN|nr:truncated hemoglobin YjbI [Geodermatophilus sabuli]SNX97501.1 hypothetical protein SAMN06893097_107143 [Geodermatophilus sabuli]
MSTAGEPDTFVRVADRFPSGVATDPVLRAMYLADLGPARQRRTAFRPTSSGLASASPPPS